MLKCPRMIWMVWSLVLLSPACMMLVPTYLDGKVVGTTRPSVHVAGSTQPSMAPALQKVGAMCLSLLSASCLSWRCAALRASRAAAKKMKNMWHVVICYRNETSETKNETK